MIGCMAVTVAFVYNRRYSKFDYGPTHPLRVSRLPLTVALMEAYGLLEHPDLEWIEAQPAEQDKLLAFHTQDYLAILRQANQGDYRKGFAMFGLGPGDNPIFTGVYDWAALLSGASLQAALLVADHKADIAFNIAGGHAPRTPPQGLGVLFHERRGRGHQGADGQGPAGGLRGHRRPPRRRGPGRLLLHQQGPDHLPAPDRADPFPGHRLSPGDRHRRGPGLCGQPALHGPDRQRHLSGRLRPHRAAPGQGLWTRTSWSPSWGWTPCSPTPLANLILTDRVITHTCRFFKQYSGRWVALGGGGYHMVNVARCWTLALAEMLGVELENELPAKFLLRLRELEPERTRLRNEERKTSGTARLKAEDTAQAGGPLHQGKRLSHPRNQIVIEKAYSCKMCGRCCYGQGRHQGLGPGGRGPGCLRGPYGPGIH